MPALPTELRPAGAPHGAAADPLRSRRDELRALGRGPDRDRLALPMLKTVPAWSLFKDGIVNSLVLIVGTLAATLASRSCWAGPSARARPAALAGAAGQVALQSSPIVLTLVIAATVAHALFAYSTVAVLGAAIVALGLVNGSNAGQAIGEAMWNLRAEGDAGPALFGRALSRAATQIVSFLINAAKGTPIASFIGAPELLSALTDITSFSSGRATTYAPADLLYRRGAGRGLAVRQAQADP